MPYEEDRHPQVLRSRHGRWRRSGAGLRSGDGGAGGAGGAGGSGGTTGARAAPAVAARETAAWMAETTRAQGPRAAGSAGRWWHLGEQRRSRQGGRAATGGAGGTATGGRGVAGRGGGAGSTGVAGTGGSVAIGGRGSASTGGVSGGAGAAAPAGSSGGGAAGSGGGDPRTPVAAAASSRATPGTRLRRWRRSWSPLSGWCCVAVDDNAPDRNVSLFLVGQF